MNVVDQRALSELSGRFESSPVGDVHFGKGCIRKLGDLLDRDGVERAVLIASRSIAANRDLMQEMLDTVGKRCAVVFTETIPHVPRASVIEASRMTRSASADAVISFGGSTQSDTAKAVVWALAAEIKRPDQFEPFAIRFEYPATRVIPSLSGKALPIYAVPTTLSAGEFTHIVGITNELGEKQLFQDRQIAPKAVCWTPR